MNTNLDSNQVEILFLSSSYQWQEDLPRIKGPSTFRDRVQIVFLFCSQLPSSYCPPPAIGAKRQLIIVDLYTATTASIHEYYSNYTIKLTYGPHKAVAEVSNHNEPIGRKSGIQLVRKIRKSMGFTFSCFVLN